MMKRKQLLLTVLSLLLCMLSPSAYSQQTQFKLSGEVTDEQGNPVIGASILTDNPKNGVITNAEGKFEISAKANTMLKISFIGFETQQLNVGNRRVINITLKENVKQLDEVVVTAMGITRESKALSYAQQSVDTKSMTEVRDANMLNMLAGKVAGVQLISGGGPLSSTRVVIRGNNSLTGNNQPLYVVDGIPINNQMGESGDIDYGNAANSINPDDIESMEVLKGANASALYGSDAANGVILITTKKGSKKNGIGASYGYNMVFSNLSQYPTYQNIYGAGGFGRVYKANYYNVDGSSPYNPANPYGIYDINIAAPDQRSFGIPMLGFDIVGRNGDIRPYSPSPQTVSDMYKTGVTLTNSFSIDKVTDHSTVRFSYTNVNADDILKNFNMLNRHSFNLRSTAKLTNYLDLDANVKYNREDVDNRGYRNASNRNPLYVLANLPRDITVMELTPWKNPDGTPLTRKGFINPYWLINELSNADATHWILANVTLNLKLGKYFNFRVKAATDVQTKRAWRFDNYYSPFDVDGYYEEYQELTSNNNFDGLLSFRYKTKNKIQIGANLGAMLQHLESNRIMSRVNVLLQPDIKSLSNNAGNMQSIPGYWGKEKQSLFGATNLGYDNWLYIDGTIRKEWSSTLPPGKWDYFYYSFGSSVILTDMLKIKSPILSFAKVRASYAQVGNDTGFDRLYNGYSYGGIFLGDMTYYRSDATRYNSGLLPEKTMSGELGVDLRFFDGRISMDGTIYKKSSTNQIITADISKISGYNNKVFNAGEIQNKGIELSLSIVPLKLKDLEWRSTFNWSKNSSLIVSLADGIDRFEMDNVEGDACRLYVEVGKPYGVLYGKDYRRNELGQILVNINGKPLFDLDKYLGNVEPDFLGGWRNTIKYRDFDFGFTVDYRKGGLIFSRTSLRASIDGQTVQSLKGRDENFFSSLILGESDNYELQGFLEPQYTVFPGADKEGNSVLYPDGSRPKGIYVPNTIYGPDVNYWAGQTNMAWLRPMSHWTHDGVASSEYLYDGSYIKLREVNLGYSVPGKWLRKYTLLTSARFSAVGRNVAILLQHTPKGIDPEATSSVGNAQGFEKGFALPSATWGFDIKLSF